MSWHRAAARLPAPTFSSFFFHNAQWLPKPSLTRNQHHQQPQWHPVSPLPLSSYKPMPSLLPTSLSSVSRLLQTYSQLSKARLSVLNVLAVMSTMALSPLPTTIPVLLSTAVGTALCCSSANTFNQLQEVPFDAQMARTRNRPLVRRAITPLHATVFGVVTGIAGPVVLWTMTNPLTAVLGGGNILLYAGVYTYLKRKSVVNTWAGAVVGGIPALMGWTASGASLLPSSSHLFLPFQDLPTDLVTAITTNPLAPLSLFLFLYAWQFPHFNGLSYSLRGSYAQAGYRMLSILSPSKNALVALRHSLLLTTTCSVLIPLSGLTTWWFALTSLPANVICVVASWEFYKRGGAGEKQGMKVFRHSLWYMPVVLGLMMVHKQGVEWDWPWGEGKQDEVKV